MNVVTPRLVKALVVAALANNNDCAGFRPGSKDRCGQYSRTPGAGTAGARRHGGLEEEFQPRQREIVAKQAEFEELSERVQRDIAVMGETERRNAEKDLRDLQREVARLQNEFREDLTSDAMRNWATCNDLC